MNARPPLRYVTEARNATILLVHTAVFAILGTLMTAKDAQVRKNSRQMLLGSIAHDLLFLFSSILRT